MIDCVEPVNMFRREKPSEEEAKMTQLAKDVEEAGMLNRKRNQAYHRFMEKKEIEMGFLVCGVFLLQCVRIILTF